LTSSSVNSFGTILKMQAAWTSETLVSYYDNIQGCIQKSPD